jgi:hypothetical protein
MDWIRKAETENIRIRSIFRKWNHKKKMLDFANYNS